PTAMPLARKRPAPIAPEMIARRHGSRLPRPPTRIAAFGLEIVSIAFIGTLLPFWCRASVTRAIRRDGREVFVRVVSHHRAGTCGPCDRPTRGTRRAIDSPDRAVIGNVDARGHGGHGADAITPESSRRGTR